MSPDLTAFLLRVYQDAKWGFERLPLTLAMQPSEGAILRKHVSNPAPVIFDVGANLGASVAYYRRLFPKARFFAFEPDPATFARLKRRHGGDSKITLINAAVGDAPARRLLHRNAVSAVNSFFETDDEAEWVKSAPGLQKLSPVEVDIVALDQVAAEHDVERIDFLKSDTQGFEPQVLAGASRLLRERRIGLMKLEVLPGRFYKQSVRLDELEAILSPSGYRLVTIGGLHYERDGTLSYFDAFFSVSGE